VDLHGLLQVQLHLTSYYEDDEIADGMGETCSTYVRKTGLYKMLVWKMMEEIALA
jgi:hypothetical protein